MDATSFDHILRKVVILPVVALLLAAGVLGWQLEKANTIVGAIQTDDERIADTLLVGQLIVDQETGLRGYEITHDPRLLQQYYESEKALPKAFDDRRRLITNAQRRAEFDAIRNAYETWRQSFAVPLIGTIQTGGDPF